MMHHIIATQTDELTTQEAIIVVAFFALCAFCLWLMFDHARRRDE